MDEKMKAFMRLIKSAYYEAESACDYCLDDTKEGIKEDKCTALSYANACTAKYSAAAAIYYTTPELEHYEIPDLFNQFDVFTNEIRKDYAIDHSRQWVAIEFEKLEELYKNSVCSQPVVD